MSYTFELQDSDTDEKHSFRNDSKSELFESPRKSIGKRNLYTCIVLVLIVALVIAVGVGLAVGMKNNDCSATNNGDMSNVNQGQQDTNTVMSTSTVMPISTSKTTTVPVVTTTEEDKQWINEPCMTPDESPKCPWSDMPLLLVSLDGFRAEYLTRNITPNIEKLSQCGVHTPYMRAVYPTLTFPNHYTIVTGLYPESHGVVDNNMYDAKLNSTFHLFNDEKSNPAWYQGEPIWITAKKQGKKSASYFWVGTDVNISGYYPDIWNKYNGSVSFEDRVDTVLDWLTLPLEERPELILLYFNEPDHTGHGSGPVSPEVNSMLERVDQIIGKLMNGLLQRNIHNCVNKIILADHGMEKTSCSRRVFLNKYIDINKYLIFDGTIGTIHKDYYEKKVGKEYIVKKNDSAIPLNELMNSLNCKSGHLQMFTKSNLPMRHHYTNNDRIGETIIDVQAQWMVAKSSKTYCLEGNHGFDNLYKSMQALFLAHGPGFKQNYETEPFENIELYNIMSDLLNIKPAPNNGTHGVLSHILKKAVTTPTPSYNDYRLCNVARQRTTHQPLDTCLCQSLTTGLISNSSTHSPDMLPFGEPKQVRDTDSCVLYNKEYTTAYSHSFRMPLWNIFTLTATQNVNFTEESLCLVDDNRIPLNNATCHDYSSDNKSISYTHLYNPGFVSENDHKMESQLKTNLVPMYTGFREGIWKYSWRIISDFAKQPGNLSVTIGPAFDYNGDGLWEGKISKTKYVDADRTIPLPTHFYIILLRCKDNGVAKLSDCPVTKTDILSFILPHTHKVPNCMPEEEYLRENVARIRDIEFLTGFEFLTKFDVEAAARRRTYLPTSLWDTSNIAYSWKDLPCEDASTTSCPGKVPLLLISLDGFRAQYLQRKLTPVIQKMRECGVHTPYMRSVFPTVTFPNHYTIVTGLYPESHGIISNNMYDEDIEEVFSLSSKTKMDPRWWHGEPMWITAKKQNKKSATFFWPGSDVNISGVYPDIWKMYDGSVGFPERVATVIDWLTLPEADKPDFITLYFDEPDHAGHQAGPDSDQVNDQLKTVDDMLSRLMDALYHKGLHNCVNIIVIADHGFDYVSCNQLVKLPKYITDIKKLLIFDGTFGRIEREFKRYSKYNVTKNDVFRPVQSIVDELMCKNDAMKVFTKDTIPKRFHYAYNPRMGEILLDIKDKWLVSDTNNFYCSGGNHGWDNLYKTMHALFLAHGPGFKQQIQTDPFENIELYNLMAELLNIEPADNNGTMGSLHHILRNPKPLDRAVKSKTTNVCGVGSNMADVLQEACGCSVNQNLQSIDFIPENETEEAVNRISPLGVPVQSLNQSEHCILNYPNIVTGYSTNLKIPLWTSFILSQQQVDGIEETDVDDADLCLMNDHRISNISCGDLKNEHRNITVGLLYNPKMVKPTDGKDVHFSSNAVPMFKNFKLGIWNMTWTLLRQYTMKYKNLGVTVGPLYDSNGDGLVDESFNDTGYVHENSSIRLPTHFFISAVKCKVISEELPCSTGGVDILSFIIPHTDQIPNCLIETDFLKDNVARVKDIELITGLKFFSQKYNVSTAARMTTYLPVNLWSADLLQRWIDTSCPAVEETCDKDYQPLLLISLDGFRADYLVRNFTPYIKRLSQCGVHAKYMRSVYPTKTFPNHYSIVTGLYPESHGIIDNSMYDPRIGEKFSLSSSNATDPRWWGGEPIWNTVMKHKKIAATYFWPGSDAEIGGMRPNIRKKYDGSVTYEERVDTVLSWLELPPQQRPDLITLYFDEPDHAGHSYGPDNIAMIGHALARVDESVGRLMEGLYRRRLHNCVNIIIIADHGMSDNSCDRLISFRDYLNTGNMYIYEGAFSRINPNYKYAKHGLTLVPNPEPVSNITAKLTCQSPHFKVYEKQELPVRHHYANNERIDPVIVDVEDKWLVTYRSLHGYNKKYCSGGNHGYDNLYKSMQALFLAHGPVFKENLSIDEFENIELYNLMTEILNITAVPNNGTMGALNHILKQPPSMMRKSAEIDYTVGQNIHIQDVLQAIDNDQCNRVCSFLPEKKYEVCSLLYLSSMMQMDSSYQLPYGLPVVQLSDKSIVRVLYQPSFVTAYRNDLDTPLWIGYTLFKPKQVMPAPLSSCVIPDLRVDSKVVSEQNKYQRVDSVVVSQEKKHCTVNQNISNNNTEWTSLVDTAPIDSEVEFSHLSSVYVPMYSAFKTGIWNALQNKIYSWSLVYRNISVIIGPVFDYNTDGIADTVDEVHRLRGEDVAIPTHFFMIITRCDDTGNNENVCDNPKPLSFILPHRPDIINCQTVDQYLKDNEARVRDVEWITGLNFYANLPVDKALHIQTYLPSGPWPL